MGSHGLVFATLYVVKLTTNSPVAPDVVLRLWLRVGVVLVVHRDRLENWFLALTWLQGPDYRPLTLSHLTTYTGCSRRNVPDFGRVFLMLKYTDITQNTYIQSWTVMGIMAREKWGLLAVPNTATCTADTSRDSASILDSECCVHCAFVMLCAVSHVTSPLGL